MAGKKQTEAAFNEIYQKYAKLLYGYALQLCGDTVTAEDILQTAFLKAIEHVDSFEGKCEVSTWLCQIAKHVWFDMRRRKECKNISVEHMLEQQGEAFFYESNEKNADPLGGLIQREESTRLHKQIHLLKEPYKEVFMLRVMGCLSFREIGEIFGKSETWGRVTFYRAKEKLKDQIGDDGDE